MVTMPASESIEVKLGIEMRAVVGLKSGEALWRDIRPIE